MKQCIQAVYFSLLASTFLSLSGCGPQLDSQQEMDLDPNEIRTILIDPSSSEQTVSIAASSDGTPINVFVYLSEDEEAVNRAVTLESPSDKILAGQKEIAKISLTAKIPANKEASVRLQTASPNKAKVTLKISN